MFWSDSLNNTQFLRRLSDNLKNGGHGVFNTNDLDSVIIMSLGKSDEIVGATNGYLTLNSDKVLKLSLIHISEPTRPAPLSRMPSSA